MSNYVPKPIETSGVVLTSAQRQLIEDLTENAHDVWAAQRLKDGWTVGKERNDQLKTHPCLIPFDKLEDDEKAYDRVIVEQTLKAALALGFDIVKP